MTSLSYPAPGRPTALNELAALYGLDGLIAWQNDRGIIVMGQNRKANREGWTRISRAALASCPDPAIPWYSALELLADELRVDVDRGAIKAEVLRALREAVTNG